MNRRLIFAGALAILIAVVGGAWLRAAPSIGETAVTPTVVGVNTPTQVTVTTQISDTTLIPTSINLLRVDSAGRVLANLGAMFDDGTNGDTTSGDRTFSRAVMVNEATTGQLRFQVSAAFRGFARRVTSDTLSIPIWKAGENNPSGARLLYPPTWELKSTNSGVILSNVSTDAIIRMTHMGTVPNVTLDEWVREFYAGELDYTTEAPTVYISPNGVRFLVVEHAPDVTSDNIAAYAVDGNRVIQVGILPVRQHRAEFHVLLSSIRFTEN